MSDLSTCRYLKHIKLYWSWALICRLWNHNMQRLWESILTLFFLKVKASDKELILKIWLNKVVKAQMWVNVLTVYGPQILIGLLVIRNNSIAHFPRGKTRLQLCSIKTPLRLPLLLLPKQSSEGLEFALSPSLCRRKRINDSKSHMQSDHQSLYRTLTLDNEQD